MNLADKTVLNILAKSSQAFLLMISSVVMVRYFPKDEYGTFLQIMLIANTAIMFTSLGLPQSIYYFFQQAVNRKNFVTRNVVLSLIIGGGTAFIVYGLQGQLAGWLNNPRLVEFGWVAPILVFFRAPSYFREPILLSNEWLILNSVLTLLTHTIFFSPLIIAAFLSVSLTTLLQVMLVASGIQWIMYLASMLWLTNHIEDLQVSEHDTEKSQHTISLITQLRYAFPIGVSSYMGIIGRQIDQYIVSAFFMPKEFAVYSRGALRIPMLSTIQFTVNDIMMPRYVNAYKTGDIPGLLQNFHTCIEKVAKINFPVFSFLFAVAPSMVIFLYTEDYLASASVLRVYLCLLLLSIAVYSVIPRASGKTSYIMYITGTTICCNILLSIFFVSRFGPIGAALATLVAEIIAAGYYLIQSCKILHISFRTIFPWKYLFQLLGSALAASIPVYLIEFLFAPKGGAIFFVLVLDGLVYSYCFAFLAMRGNVIQQDDLSLLRKWLHFDVERVLRKITFLSS